MNNKNLKKKVFHHELLSTIVFHDYIEKVNSLENTFYIEKDSFSSYLFLKIVFF
jgi:hypothetical protein